MKIKTLIIKLSDVDRDVLNSATQKGFKPSVSLMALCGDIIVEVYQKERTKDALSDDLISEGNAGDKK